VDKEELYDVIDRHLRNELTGEEAKQLEELIQKDPDFANSLALHKEIQFTLADKGLRNFQQLVKEADEAYAAAPPSAAPRKIIPLYLKIAASVALLVAIGAAIFLMRTPPSHTDLFNEYFATYSAPVNFRSGDSPYADEDWKQALAYYDGGHYEEAIPYLTKVIANKPSNKLAQLLRGVGHLALGATAEAEQDFNALIEQGENLFVDQAKWYLALTYLKQGDTEKAKSLLDALRQEKPGGQAEELWERLR
jgi:tetratricopeptide (TPR) repeat protein